MVERTIVRKHYDPKLSPARERFAESPGIQRTFRKTLTKKEALSFLINFSAMGVEMTRPVDRWIYRAGERCKEIGMTELGDALCAHAHHEEGHHELMISDTRYLVAVWNDAGHDALDAEALISRTCTQSVADYCELHERVIKSDAPYAQLAIELEIEALSVRYGGPLVELATATLGEEIAAGLSFLSEHATLDVGHTAFNEGQLDRFLRVHPDALEPLVAAGCEALEIYARFLSDCASRPLVAARSVCATA